MYASGVVLYLPKHRLRKGQTTFYQHKDEVVMTHDRVRTEIVLGSSQKQFVCPYCLHIDNINNYLISTHGSISHLQRQCPDCHVIMRAKTLHVSDTIVGYVSWLRSVMHYDKLTGKIKWDMIKMRLRERGIATKFWEEFYLQKYEELPAEAKPPSFEEFLEYERSK